MTKLLSNQEKIFLTASHYWGGQDVCWIHIRNTNGLFENMLLVTSQSRRHSKSLGQSFRLLIKHLSKQAPQSYGSEEGNWILIDGEGLCIQILTPEMRQTLNFEELFADSEQIHYSEKEFHTSLPQYRELLEKL